MLLKFKRAAGLFSADKKQRILFLGAIASLLTGSVWLYVNRAQAIRFEERGMYINSARAGDTTFYEVSFKYPTANSVGSVRMEFCDTPIPSLPCNVPSGLDVSGGVLSSQSGETGFSIVQQTGNLIILGRTPSVTGSALSTYRFDDMVNPSGETQDFYIRLTSHASNDGSGPLIDFGSVSAQLTPEIEIWTQVPPILVFCVAAIINSSDCTDAEGNFVNFGELQSNQTYYASSEILTRTNARSGVTVYAAGTTMTSGIRTIPAITTPTESFVGVGQFGINFAVNSTPSVGASPTGPGANLVLEPDYDIPDKYHFNSGDTVAVSTSVTPWRKITASYIVNVPQDQPPGVYSTTITYIGLATF